MINPMHEVMKFPSGKDGSPAFTKLQYPRWASLKYDGSYCLIFEGELFSRNLKLHPNIKLKERFAPLLNIKDMVFMGELVDLTGQFHDTQSIARSYTADLGSISLMIFDSVAHNNWVYKSGDLPFEFRYQRYLRYLEGLSHEYIQPVYQEVICDADVAQVYYDEAISHGHEGIVSRDPRAYYKYGRCTRAEDNLFRHTPMERCEARILEVLEKLERKDGVEVGRLLDGRAHRSFKKADHQLAGTAGSVRVRDEYGREYKVGFGKGWDNDRKNRLWKNRLSCVGRLVEVEYKPVELSELPRQPKLVRFRDDKDNGTGRS